LCALAMWSLILIHNQVALVIGGSIIGIGFVIAFPSWMAHISAICHPKDRGAGMGAVCTRQSIRAMVGVRLGVYLYEHANIPLPFVPTSHPNHYVPFVGCAILLIVSWLLAVFTIKDSPEP